MAVNSTISDIGDTMLPVTKNFAFKLDIKESLSTDATLVCGDTGNIFTISVCDGGSPVILTGRRVIAVFSSENGCTFLDTSVPTDNISVFRSTVTLCVPKCALAPGICECELQIYSDVPADDDTLITTASFTFLCRDALCGGNALTNMPEHGTLAKLIDDVSEALSLAGTTHVHLRFREVDPAAVGDHALCVSPARYMGIYIGQSSVAPLDPSQYTWVDTKAQLINDTNTYIDSIAAQVGGTISDISELCDSVDALSAAVSELSSLQSEVDKLNSWVDAISSGLSQSDIHALKYFIDDELYKVEYYALGATISDAPVPTREGHSFSGWGTVPATMPANDVTITGAFTKNSYTLTFKVDLVTVSTASVLYGASITPPAFTPASDRRFDGFADVPASMPANDLTISGTTSELCYNASFVANGSTVSTQSFAYDESTLTLPAVPFVPGFYGSWEDFTLDNADITVNAVYTPCEYVTVTGDEVTISPIAKARLDVSLCTALNEVLASPALEKSPTNPASFFGKSTVDFTMRTKNLLCSSDFAEGLLDVNASNMLAIKSGRGTLTSSGGVLSYSHGDSELAGGLSSRAFPVRVTNRQLALSFKLKNDSVSPTARLHVDAFLICNSRVKARMELLSLQNPSQSAWQDISTTFTPECAGNIIIAVYNDPLGGEISGTAFHITQLQLEYAGDATAFCVGARQNHSYTLPETAYGLEGACDIIDTASGQLIKNTKRVFPTSTTLDISDAAMPFIYTDTHGLSVMRLTQGSLHITPPTGVDDFGEWAELNDYSIVYKLAAPVSLSIASCAPVSAIDNVESVCSDDCELTVTYPKTN